MAPPSRDQTAELPLKPPQPRAGAVGDRSPPPLFGQIPPSRRTRVPNAFTHHVFS